MSERFINHNNAEIENIKNLEVEVGCAEIVKQS